MGGSSQAAPPAAPLAQTARAGGEGRVSQSVRQTDGERRQITLQTTALVLLTFVRPAVTRSNDCLMAVSAR